MSHAWLIYQNINKLNNKVYEHHKDKTKDKTKQRWHNY